MATCVSDPCTFPLCAMVRHNILFSRMSNVDLCYIFRNIRHSRFSEICSINMTFDSDIENFVLGNVAGLAEFDVCNLLKQND